MHRLLTTSRERAISAALVSANLNSLPLDWAARLSVGGTHMSFFIVKQLPVLPPEAYLEEASQGMRYAELVVPRVLELTYTAHDLQGFAQDLGYDGPPFLWDEDLAATASSANSTLSSPTCTNSTAPIWSGYWTRRLRLHRSLG